jgi:cytoskeletal protein CcmA (bactofilin family)
VFQKVIGKNQEPGDSGESVTMPAPQPLRPPAPAPAPQAAAYPPPSKAPLSVGTRNILSSDVDIKGTVRFTNDLLVDGRIEGEINSDGNLTVGENARLRAEIRTASIFIHGKVHGNITVTERCELRAGSEVVGDLKAKTLFVEAGAVFVGKSEVGTPSTLGETKPQLGQQSAVRSVPAQQPVQSQAKPQSQPVLVVKSTASSTPPPKQGTLAGTD